jgi:hypothetical protein
MQLVRLILGAALLAGAACGGGGGSFVDGGPDTPTVTSATPEHGPLGGGNRVVLHGNGFLLGGAPPNRVMVAGIEATAAGVIDDNSIEVVMPPGEAAGDVEFTVFNQNGYATASGIYSYNPLPVISGVTPAEVIYTATSTQMNIIGTGFTQNDAGTVRVYVDGVEAVDVEVVNDTTITFTALTGPALSRPDVSVVNLNGEAVAQDGFRYVPATADGLLVFTNTGAVFAYYFDPATNTKIPIPSVDNDPTTGQVLHVRSIYTDSNGDYWVQNRAGEHGRFDATTQRVIDPLTPAQGVGRYSAMVAVGDTIYAMDRNTRKFGTIDPETAVHTPIGATTIGNSRYGLARNAAGTMFVAFGTQIAELNITDGTTSNAVTLSPAIHVGDMRFFNGTLYAATNTGELATINTSTGATAIITNLGIKTGAIEVFQ